ncbi:DUF4097 family beta strand repeat-containing protein [Arenimonas sp.]|uniref:DUF4097 family beta strand repeat-containing protein n=1 Tax=Arenimonas sp. TaxID=1872635 RepID=UPI0039E414D0
MSLIKLAPLALAIAALPAFAGTPINETRALAADGSVSIENIKGRIIVRTWAQPQVRITGSLGKGAEKLEVDGDGRDLSIEVKYPDHKGNWSWNRNDFEPTTLEITVPQKASLDIESVAADVDVQQMAGRKLDVSSVSGNVVVTASSPGQATVENVSGDITLRITTDSVDVENVSGDINIQGGLSGRVSVETVSGNATVLAKTLSKLQFSSVSGDADLQAALATNGVVTSETVSGTLRLGLPKATSAQLSIETFSGDINSPVGKVDREEYGPGKSLNARLGQGQGKIRLESFSGNVNVELK